MDRAEAEAIFDAGRDVCARFILDLGSRVERHEDRLRRLEEQARQDSRTSSKPPSSDPPKTRQHWLGAETRMGSTAANEGRTRLVSGLRSVPRVGI